MRASQIEKTIQVYFQTESDPKQSDFFKQAILYMKFWSTSSNS